MTFKYRDHRGSLADSMETLQTFESEANLIAFLTDDLKKWGFTVVPNLVVIEPYGYDARIGWDAQIVTINGFGVVGFTDSPIRELVEKK